MTMVHVGAHVVHQHVRTTERTSWSRPNAGGREVTYRERLTKQIHALFGPGHSLVNQTLRPDARLSAEQLWQVYKESGDVRAAVESISRKVSTKKWGLKPIPAVDDDQHKRGLEQCRAINRFLKAPNEDETWQTFIFKVALDSLVFWHGTIENAFSQVAVVTVDEHGAPQVELERGPIEEFVAVYGGSIYAVSDSGGRIIGYVQDLGLGRQVGSGADNVIRLDKASITRLMLNPNTRSPYPVPIIETLVKEVTILVRGSERAMLEVDVGEIPDGFLILTGTNPKVEKEMKESARHHRGRKHKLRIIHSPGATSPAHWLRLQRGSKEIEQLPIAAEARKLIWRMFGVSPVSQGETTSANRSDSDAMLSVDEDGLFGPVLELVEGIVNTRMITLLVEKVDGPDAEVLCEFSFDRKKRLTPEEEKDQAEADDKRLKQGTRNINELRARDGLPPIEGGDIYRVDGQDVGGLENDDDGDDDGDGGGDGTTTPESGEAAPGEQRGRRVQLDRGQVRELVSRMQGGSQTHVQEYLRALLEGRALNRDDLPSAWQSPGLFDDHRTVDLPGLWDQVVAYRNGVEPLWKEAKSELLAVTSAAWTANTLGGNEHLSRVGEILDALRERWSMETLRRYRSVGELSRDSALGHVDGAEVGANSDAAAVQFHEQAMGYLNQLMSDVKTRVLANISAVTAARAKTSAEAGLGPDSDLGELLDALDKSMNGNEHRIDNWSGRLVQLANSIMAAAMLEAPPFGEAEFAEGEPAPAPDPDAPTRAGEWYVSWEAVGDEGTCETCEREGNLPIRPLSTLTTVPGGNTECQARCRCVLVYWTKTEFDDGTAQKIIRSIGPVFNADGVGSLPDHEA